MVDVTVMLIMVIVRIMMRIVMMQSQGSGINLPHLPWWPPRHPLPKVPPSTNDDDNDDDDDDHGDNDDEDDDDDDDDDDEAPRSKVTHCPRNKPPYPIPWPFQIQQSSQDPDPL